MKCLRTVCGVILLLPILVFAQEGGAGYVNLRILTVKPDRVAQWEDLIAERVSEVRETDLTFFHVYQRVRGPLQTFLIITPGTQLGQSVAPPASPHWVSMLFGTLASQSLVTLQNFPEATTNTSGSAHPGGDYMYVRLRTVAAGRSADYEQWLTDELIPSLAEAGEDDVRTLRIVVGGSPRTWATFSFIDSWPRQGPNLDQRMLDRGEAMVVEQTNYLYEFRDDLSFTAN